MDWNPLPDILREQKPTLTPEERHLLALTNLIPLDYLQRHLVPLAHKRNWCKLRELCEECLRRTYKERAKKFPVLQYIASFHTHTYTHHLRYFLFENFCEYAKLPSSLGNRRLFTLLWNLDSRAAEILVMYVMPCCKTIVTDISPFVIFWTACAGLFNVPIITDLRISY